MDPQGETQQLGLALPVGLRPPGAAEDFLLCGLGPAEIVYDPSEWEMCVTGQDRNKIESKETQEWGLWD